ncbi:hypothetical protein I305_06559 [Cryptococcus gattii E566]|nr:hypothetical protein I305_06559 [Cryptococcus gattii E566]
MSSYSGALAVLSKHGGYGQPVHNVVRTLWEVRGIMGRMADIIEDPPLDPRLGAKAPP